MDQKKQLTKGLFLESCPNDRLEDHQPKWTLRLEDYEYKGKLYKSAYRVYMDSATEFEAAMTICDGNFEKWKQLCNLKWFKEGRTHTAMAHIGLDAWREQKQLQDYTQQIKNLQEKAANGDTNAAKAIIQLIEKADKKAQAGRPKKNTQVDPLHSMVKDFEEAKKRFRNNG